MRRNICFILLAVLFCYSGCGKNEDSMSQGEAQQYDYYYIYNRFTSLISSSVRDYPDCWTDRYGGVMNEDSSGKVWTFEFDDEWDVERYNTDVSIKVEMLEELSARYTVYANGQEVDNFEARLYNEPPDLKAFYVDITDGAPDVVIIGSTDSGGFQSAPWVYAYDLENGERIHIFDSYDDSYNDSNSQGECSIRLTEKQREQAKKLVKGDKGFKKLFPEGNINYDNSDFGGVPMLDAEGNVYFEMPIWGNDSIDDVDGTILLLLKYNADTKEFDVYDILY